MCGSVAHASGGAHLGVNCAVGRHFHEVAEGGGDLLVEEKKGDGHRNQESATHHESQREVPSRVQEGEEASDLGRLGHARCSKAHAEDRPRQELHGPLSDRRQALPRLRGCTGLALDKLRGSRTGQAGSLPKRFYGQGLSRTAPNHLTRGFSPIQSWLSTHKSPGHLACLGHEGKASEGRRCHPSQADEGCDLRE